MGLGYLSSWDNFCYPAKEVFLSPLLLFSVHQAEKNTSATELVAGGLSKQLAKLSRPLMLPLPLHCFSNTPRKSLPQCLCICCSLCLEHYLPRNCLHFLQVFTLQESSYQRGCSYSMPPTSLSVPLFCRILLRSSNYLPT